MTKKVFWLEILRGPSNKTVSFHKLLCHFDRGAIHNFQWASLVLKLARLFWLDGIIKIGDRECNGIPRWACLVVICGPDRGPDPTTDERDSVSARSSRFTVSFHENHAVELFRRTLWPIKNCRRASFIAIANEMRLCKQFEELIIINNRERND